MMLVSLLLGTAGAATFFASGFLLAARRGVSARDALRLDAEGATTSLRVLVAEADRLREETQRLQGREAALAAELGSLRASADVAQNLADGRRVETAALQANTLTLRAEHARIQGEAEARKQELARTRELLQRSQDDLAAARGELADLVAKVAERGKGQAEGQLREVQRVLAPLMEKERLAKALAALPVGRGTRDRLPDLLEAIARAAGFDTVLVSDEAGLPLATNAAAEEADQLAGIWSMLLTIADRVVVTGAPAPLSILVQDADGQTIVHRIFSAGQHRYLLTAVGRGGALSPTTLDPAITKLEALLTHDAWRLPA